MANEFVIKVTLSDDGSGKRTVQSVRQVSGALNEVERAHKRASKEADTHFHKQDKGIIGTANSSRSFSKLAQSINGDNNSLVGAYAALAANIFAVTAAFMALKNAAEVEQVIEGLAASGARLGLSYKNAIIEVRNASEGLLTLEQSARSTAQVLSAGFNSDQLTRITSAAKDASFALGRDMSESMDRLTRGVIKLEPELLDELGIMVRLDEASATYARSLGKSTSALTAAEKRQGFFNATMAEVEAKFGGLAVGANTSASALNKLSTTFADLTKTIFNGLNVALVPLVKLISSSPVSLLGGMLLFASAIKGQLIPGLVGMADNSAKAAEATRDLINQKIAAEVADKKYLGNTALSKAYFNSLTEGTYSAEQASLALQAAEGRVTEAKASGSKYRINAAEAEVTAIKSTTGAIQKASAIQTSANAQVLASQGRYKEALKTVSVSIAEYSSATKLSAVNTGILTKAAGASRIAIFALSAAAKTATIAFINFLPYIGIIVMAIGLLYTGVKKLAGEGYQKLTEANKAYTEVLKTSTEALIQYNKLNESTASSFTKVTSQAKIAGNSVTSLAKAFQDVKEAQEGNSGFGKFLTGVKEFLSFSRAKDLSNLSESTGLTVPEIDKNYELIKTFEKMKKFKGTSGIIKEIFGEEGPRLIGDYQVAVALLTERFNTLTSAIEGVEAAFNEGEKASSDFIKAATPTTPFDALSNSLYGINGSLSTYIDQINKGTATAEDFKDVLSGIPAGVSQLLGGNIAQRLSNPGGAQEVQKELIILQEQFDTNRKITLEKQGQLAIAQAAATVAGKSASITAAEVEHKINAENRVIDIQIEQLNMQKIVLDTIIAQNKAKLDALFIDQQSLDLLKDKSEFEIIALNQEKINGLAHGSAEREYLIQINEQLRIRQSLIKDNFNAQAGSNNLASQMTALEMGKTSRASKEAQKALAKAEIEVFWAQRALTIADNKVKTAQNYAGIQEEILGFSSNQEDVEKALKEQYSAKYSLILKESDARIKALESQKALSNTAEERYEIDLRISEEQLGIRLGLAEQLKQEYDLNRIKAAGFKTETERLSTAKNLLDIQLQQAEAIASAAEAQTALNIRQKRFEAGSRQLTATEERQLAFEAAEAALDAALATQELKAKGIKAEYALLDAQYALEMIKLDNTTKALARLKPSLSGDELVAADANIVANMQALDAYAAIRKNLGAQETAALDLLGINIANLRLAVQETGTVGALSGQARTFSATSTLGENSNLGFNKETILALSEDLSPFIEDLKKLGPQGEYVSAVVEGALIIADSFRRIGEEGLTSAEGLSAVGSIIGQVAKIAQSSAQAKIAAVDQEIAAEQKRDGKSSESLARIQAMEKKKDSIAKKSFEIQKKLQMAQAVISTAAAITGILSQSAIYGPFTIPLAAAIGAMGLAQIGIIASTQYQSTSSAASVATPSAVSVGKRSDSVNLARNNSTPGGELGYLTGAQGSGTNASNFRPRAYGGYGHSGMIVGEKGPEVFTPSVPGQITPNDKVSGQQAAPVNFHINAIDAEGVEQVLTNQRGHIIGMLREAANANGERFLENIDTNKYKPRGRRI